MASQIHPTAIVEPGAQLGADVQIGAYAFIGRQVVLGDRCVVHHHGNIEGHTFLGPECEVFPFACIGMKTQDLKFKGGNPGTRIGRRNVFREYASVHAATNDGEFTTLGDHNLFLAYCHVAHDCQIGSHVIASNETGIAGHCIVEDHVIFGAKSGIHQFCRIGAYAMISAMSKVVQDVPPFLIVDGNAAIARAINKVGLERNGFTPEQVERAKNLFRLCYRAGLNRTQAVEAMRAHEHANTPEYQHFLRFVGDSERGVVAGK